MRNRLGAALGGLMVAGSLLLTGCGSMPPETVMPPLDATPSDGAPQYDPEVEPSLGVLALIPDTATELRVTDYDQMKLHLGQPDLASNDPVRERNRFWKQARSRLAMLSQGLLNPVSAQLQKRFNWSQIDVDWEAEFTGPDGDGWVIKISDRMPMGDVSRAVEAGIGPLAQATVYPEDHLVTLNTTEDGDQSWANHPELIDLVGDAGTATYVTRSCIPFDGIYGPGVFENLAPTPAADIQQLEEVTAWSVTFGGELVAARLGELRGDVFTRLGLIDALPTTKPDFAQGYQRGVADPAGGRLGFTLGDPRVAVELVEQGKVPFALCAE